MSKCSGPCLVRLFEGIKPRSRPYASSATSSPSPASQSSSARSTQHTPFNPNSHNASDSVMKTLLWAFPVVTFGLGTWQMYRLQWKLDMIEKLKQQLHGASIPLSSVLKPDSFGEEMDNLKEFQKFKLRGRFLNHLEMCVGPRNRGIAGGEASRGGGLAGNSATVGYFIYVPFELEDGRRVIVNKGWVPRDLKSLESRPGGAASGVVEIEGVLRHGENPASFPTSLPGKNEWYCSDLEKMSQHASALPIIIDMLEDSTINKPLLKLPGAPLARISSVNLTNNHLSYAITWYGMSMVRYCSRECQKADWPTHKPECLKSITTEDASPPARQPVYKNVRDPITHLLRLEDMWNDEFFAEQDRFMPPSTEDPRTISQSVREETERSVKAFVDRAVKKRGSMFPENFLCEGCQFPAVFNGRCACEYCGCQYLPKAECLCGAYSRIMDACGIRKYEEENGYDHRVKWFYSYRGLHHQFDLELEHTIEQKYIAGDQYVMFNPENPAAEGLYEEIPPQMIGRAVPPEDERVSTHRITFDNMRVTDMYYGNGITWLVGSNPIRRVGPPVRRGV
ncbi:Surfeit locus protein 1 [Blyttiomyces sp. JEL0837]|nr:Surfeit locus protein 1 [Blyttiomyces sp. JEL0837]